MGWEEIIGPLGPKVAEVANPEPQPWRVAVFQLAEAAQARDIASRLPKGTQKEAMLKSASGAIDSVIDDWCGTPPRKHPWPWPGPPPWVWSIVSELSLLGNSLQAGGLRDELLSLAGQLATRAA